MKTAVIAIFDIGKTNKKFFLFDHDFRVVEEKVQYIEPTTDDEGEECEDIVKLSQWINDTLNNYYHNEQFLLHGVNFSAYGASFVHIGQKGTPVLPLYNYLKNLPLHVIEQFLERYGPEDNFTLETAAPLMHNMLNSGMQLYWLKQDKPQLFNTICQSLHLPQYCSYLVSKNACSEISSIGCHTALWSFHQNDYHNWVYEEGIHHLFPPIKSVFSTTSVMKNGSALPIGTGVHDSSAALFPYVDYFQEPFVLISTGTWSISMNPFSSNPIQFDELNNNCLNYIGVTGTPIRASRLFLGNEHHYHVQRIAQHFNVSEEACQNEPFNKELAQKTNVNSYNSQVQTKDSGQLIADYNLSQYKDYRQAYYHLISDLVTLQVDSTKLAIGQAHIRKVILTGGFYNNEIFLSMLAARLKYEDIVLYIADLKRASAVGAAMVLKSGITQNANLQKLFKLRKIIPPEFKLTDY